MSLVGAFVELNIDLGGKVNHPLLGLGADGRARAVSNWAPAWSAGLSWEVYNEGGHGALWCAAMLGVED